MPYIESGVGAGQPNAWSDVMTVQFLLNKWIVPGGIPDIGPLVCDGLCGKKTTQAITSFNVFYPTIFPPRSHFEPKGAGFARLEGPLPDWLMGRIKGNTPAKPAPKKNGLTRDEQAKVEELLRKYDIAGADAEVVRKWITRGTDTVTALGQIEDILTIVDTFRISGMASVGGQIGGISQISGFSAALGVVGPIAMFVGFAFAAGDILARQAQQYMAIAIAFWLVAWGHGLAVPKGCPDIKRRFLALDDVTSAELDTAWKAGCDAAPNILDRIVGHIYDETPAHMTRTRCRETLRAIWAGTDRTKLARALLMQMRDSFKEETVFGGLWGLVPGSENAATAVFFTSEVPRITYP